MEYLPGLTSAQKAFADHYYPVFDEIKSSVLMAAGIVLLLEDGQALSQDFETNINTISADIEQSARTWQAYAAPAELAGDHAVVAQAIENISASIKAVTQSLPYLENELIAKMSTDLLEDYQDLRAVALDYWRLELVAESAGHFHGHDEHTHHAED